VDTFSKLPDEGEALGGIREVGHAQNIRPQRLQAHPAIQGVLGAKNLSGGFRFLFQGDPFFFQGLSISQDRVMRPRNRTFQENKDPDRTAVQEGLGG
jgi:hypothetical protein